MKKDINSVKYWEEAINAGQDFKRTYAESDRWDDFTDYYRNKFRKGILPYNLIFSIGRALIPQIYFRNPTVVITPRIVGYEVQAQLLQKIDNFIIQEIRLKEQIKQTILRTFLFGTGIIKTGFDTEFGYSVKDEGTKRKIEYNTFVGKGLPWGLSVHPEYYVMPWGVSSFHDKPWEAFGIFRYTDDVRMDPKYNQKARSEVKSTHTYKGQHRSFFNQAKADWTLLWEIHDLRDGRIKVFADGHDKWLRLEDDPTQLGEGLPAVGLIFNGDPEVGWGVADAVILDPQQKELNEIRTQMMKHRRLALVKFLCNRTKVDEDELEKLFNEDVGASVFVDGPVHDAVLPLTAHTPGDLGAIGELVRRDARDLVGFGRNQAGEFEPGGRRTAKEVMVVQMAAQIRIDERRDLVADVLTDVVKHFNRNIWAYWDEERVESVLGPDGRKYWVGFTGTELQSEYLYKVNPDSEIPITKMLLRQEALELLQMFGNDPNIPGQQELRRWVVSQYDGIDPNKLFLPPGEGAGRSPEAPMAIAQARGLFAGKETPGRELPPNLQVLLGGVA